MFSDPLVVASQFSTVTINSGENFTFACIERAADHSTYRYGPDSSGVTWDMFIGHQFGRRNRFTVRCTASGLTPDLIVDNNNSRFSQSIYVVVDVPPTGAVSNADWAPSPDSILSRMAQMIGSFLVEATATLPLNIERVVGGET